MFTVKICGKIRFLKSFYYIYVNKTIRSYFSVKKSWTGKSILKLLSHSWLRIFMICFFTEKDLPTDIFLRIFSKFSENLLSKSTLDDCFWKNQTFVVHWSPWIILLCFCQFWALLLRQDPHVPKKMFYIIQWKPFKMMKSALYFILKALFVFKIFKFLSWIFGYAEKTASLDR